jgi:hypothetical protein
MEEKQKVCHFPEVFFTLCNERKSLAKDDEHVRSFSSSLVASQL